MRRLPLVTFLLVASNVFAYLLELGAGGQATCEQLGLVPRTFVHTGNLTPLFSSLFLHDPNGLLHLGGNMAFLVLFGGLVESAIGGSLFLVVYLASGACGGLLHVAVDPSSLSPLVGASTAICGVLAVAAALYPRLLGFVGCFMAFNIWEAVTSTGGSVSVCGHIGGFVCGVIFAMIMRATSFVEEERFA